MKEYLKKYVMLRRHNMSVAWKKAKRSKMCYVFLAPYAILFSLFVILPVISSIFFSFTYYNILEKPRFIGLSNYISLILEDDIFLIGIKNTLLIAVITGPLGYIMSFLFAWLINELPRWVRSVAVVVFYAPSIAGNCYVIFSVFFRGDAYGYVNAFLMKLGIIDSPILWFINPKYMLPICMLVILWMSLGTGFLSFVAGLQGVDRAQFEAGYMDGIRNRWQELWYITLPSMRPQLMFGAVMSITTSFGVGDIISGLFGFPSTNYAGHLVMTHLMGYSNYRLERGYACAIAVLLFILVCGWPTRILQLLSNDPAVIAEGASYLRIVGLSYVVTAFSYTMGFACRATGNVRLPMLTSLLSVATNTLLNSILIFGLLGFPELGLRGAAIATAIARVVELTVLATVVYRKRTPVAANFRQLFLRKRERGAMRLDLITEFHKCLLCVSFDLPQG